MSKFFVFTFGCLLCAALNAGDIHDLTEAFAVKKIETIDANNLIFMDTNFGGRSFPVHIEIKGEDGIWITIRGVDKEGKDDSCLILGIDRKSRMSDVLAVNGDVSCPQIPSPGTGTFVMKFVDQIGAALRLKSAKLTDLSTVICRVDNRRAHFAFLRTMLKGEGWYESMGYLPYATNLRSISKRSRRFEEL